MGCPCSPVGGRLHVGTLRSCHSLGTPGPSPAHAMPEPLPVRGVACGGSPGRLGLEEEGWLSLQLKDLRPLQLLSGEGIHGIPWHGTSECQGTHVLKHQ